MSEFLDPAAYIFGYMVLIAGGSALLVAGIWLAIEYICEKLRLVHGVTGYFLNRNEYKKWKASK